MDDVTLQVAEVFFCAALIQSAFGFGLALIAVPMLTLLLPLGGAVLPLVALVSITMACVVLLQDWHHVHVRSAAYLVLASACGIPLGLLLLKVVPQAFLKMSLAIVVMGFSLYCLVYRGRVHLQNDRLGWFFGFLSGIMGGAFAINGPPLVIYGSLRRWSPQELRATLQGYFLPTSILGLVGYWATGQWGHEVFLHYLAALPAALIGVVVGRWINRRLHTASFTFCVHLGVIALACFLLIQSLKGHESGQP